MSGPGEPGRAAAWLTALVPPLWALLVALAAAGLLLAAAGVAPARALELLAAGTWRSGYGFGQVLFKATPLLFAGLAVRLALEAGLFNIGAEGQLTLGAFATAMLGAALPVATPRPLAIAAGIAAGFGAGALVGSIAGALKAWRGAHEVIITVMLNFVVRAAMVGVGAHVFLKESLHTRPIIAAAELPRLAALVPALHGSAVSWSLAMALAATLGVAWLLGHTALGFRLRAVGAAPLAAETGGISIARTTLLAMALSGGVAGLVGTSSVLGYKHYYEDGFSGGVGFMGIAVAVLGGRHPLGLIGAALLFGLLSQGGLAVNALVPKELVDVLEAVIIFAVAASGAVAARLATRASIDPAHRPEGG